MHPALPYFIPEKDKGRLVGPGGATAKKIAAMGGSVDVRPVTGVLISGDTAVLRFVAEQLDGVPPIPLDLLQKRQILVFKDRLPGLLGPKWSHVRKIQEETSTFILVDPPTGPSTRVTICGRSSRDVALAEQHIRSFIEPKQSPIVADLRAAADRDAAERCTLAQKSRKAYEEGRKKEAKALSLAIAPLTQRVLARNAEAAKLLREVQADALIKGEIDLHGFLQAEAREEAVTFVDAACERFTSVRLITGRGAHSPGQQGKLHAAVADVLRMTSFRRRISLDVSDPGCITVTYL